MTLHRVNTKKLNLFIAALDADAKSPGLGFFWQFASGKISLIGPAPYTRTSLLELGMDLDEDSGRLDLSCEGTYFITSMFACAFDSLAKGVRNRSNYAHYVTAYTPKDDVWSANRSAYRHNLSQAERKELAELVRCAIDDDGEEDSIVEFLNDHCAEGSILDWLNTNLGDAIVMGGCGHFHINGDEAGDFYSGGTICQMCADEGDYAQPEDSSEWYPVDDLHMHNNSCYYTYEEEFDDDEDEDEDSSGLLSWGTDVTRQLGGPKFESSPDGRFTIGVELELECDSRSDRSEFVQDVSNYHGSQMVCKMDGSLDDSRGVELVSSPLEYTEAVKLFKKIEYPGGARAWDNNNCGLHVHIDSRAFTSLTIAKFLRFWNDPDNAKLVSKVAGRYPVAGGTEAERQAFSYAAVVPPEGDAKVRTAQNLLKYKKSTGHGRSRYRAVNITNTSQAERERLDLGEVEDSRRFSFSTVELRIFRASLRKARATAQIEMAAASVYFVRDSSCNSLTSAAFLDWLAGHTGMFPNLASFLGVKKAHVEKDEDYTADDSDFAALKAGEMAEEVEKALMAASAEEVEKALMAASAEARVFEGSQSDAYALAG